jgi:U1 small nuclear ribonucleoprotein A
VLLSLCSHYGEVSAVHMKKNIKLRGQAWIIFKDIEAAQKCKEALKGAQLYGKEMVSPLIQKIFYSVSTTDIVAKEKGTFDQKVRVERELRRRKDFQNKQMREQQRLLDKLNRMKDQ